MTIGQRAVQEIKEHAELYGVSVAVELANIGAESRSYRMWRDGTCNPSATYLQQMAKNNYNVMWILLGDEYGK